MLARGFPLVVASGGYYSLVAVSRLLIAVAFPVAKHGLQSTGSVVVAYGLSCPEACGTFPSEGSNLCPLHQQVDS